MPTSAVVTPAKLTLFTRGGVYELQAVQASFAKNGVNTCLCNLAVGRNAATGSVQNIAFERGDEAQVFVNDARITSEVNRGEGVFTADNYRLFDGVIDDFGPSSLSYGKFAVQVRLFGRLALLASGTLGTSNVVSKSYLDTTIGPVLGQGTQDPSQIDLASGDLWAGLSAALTKIAANPSVPAGGVTSQILNTFGADINADALAVLGEVVGSLTWNAGASALKGGIISVMNTMMIREWFYESFLNRILGFGEMLRFALIENGSGIKVAPYHPFFHRRDARVIYDRTQSAGAWRMGDYNNYSGAVLVAGSGSDVRQKGGSDLTVGIYKMSGNPLGKVHVGPVPPYLTDISTSAVGGGAAARSVIPGTTAVGNDLAKIMTWELNFKNYNYQVRVPHIRADIGPLEAVRVDFPRSAEIQAGTDTPAIYGSVQRVTIAIDAMQQFAETIYDVGYVRSYNQQKFQIDPDIEPGEHPFFSTNYIGGRLDSSQARGVSVA